MANRFADKYGAADVEQVVPSGAGTPREKAAFTQVSTENRFAKNYGGSAFGQPAAESQWRDPTTDYEKRTVELARGNVFEGVENEHPVARSERVMNAVTGYFKGYGDPEQDSFLDVAMKIPDKLAVSVGSKVSGIQRARADLAKSELDIEANLSLPRMRVMPDAVRAFRETGLPPPQNPSVIAEAKASGVTPEQFTFTNFKDYENLTPEKRSALFDASMAKRAAAQKKYDALSQSADKARARTKMFAEYAAVNTGEWSPESLLLEGIGALPDVGMAGAAAMVGGPAAGSAVLLGEVAPAQYEAGRAQGLSPERAIGYTALTTAAEFIGEVPVFHVLAKTPAGKATINKLVGKYAETLGGKAVGVAAIEGFGEQVTEALNIGIENGLYDGNVTVPEAFNRLAKAGVIGSLVGGGLGVMAHKSDVNQRGANAATGEMARQADLDATAEMAGRAAPPLAFDADAPRLSGPREDADFDVGVEGVARRPGEELAPKVPLPQLPAPKPTGEFEVSPEGARELSQNELNAAEEARVQRAALGSDNIITMPSESRTADTIVEPPAVQSRAAQRRAKFDAERERVQQAIPEEAKPNDLTIKRDKEGWTISHRGEPQVTYTSEAVAREELRALRAEVAEKNKTLLPGNRHTSVKQPSPNRLVADIEVLGNAFDASTADMHGYNSLNRERKHVVLAQVIASLDDKKILNSVIKSVPIDVMHDLIGEKTSPEKLLNNPSMLAHSLAVPRNVPVPKRIGRFIDSVAAIVKSIPASLTTEASAFKAAKPPGDGDTTSSARLGDERLRTNIGSTRNTAKKVFLGRESVQVHPGIVSSAATSAGNIDDGHGVGSLKAGVMKAGAAETAPVARTIPKRNTLVAQAGTDSILEYLSKTKLYGAATSGLNIDALASEGLDPKEMQGARGHGINRPFTKGGGTLDHAAEILTEAGYPVGGDKNKLLDLIAAEIRTGKKTTAGEGGVERQLEKSIAKAQERAPAESLPENVDDMNDDELAAFKAKLDRLQKSVDTKKDSNAKLNEAAENTARRVDDEDDNGGMSIFEPRKAYASAQLRLPFDDETASRLAKIETRPDTAPEQSKLGIAALRSLVRGRDYRKGARVLSHAIPREFVEKGFVSLIGRKISSHMELAELAQIYRDPRFETFRVFFMKGDEVVHQTGISSRLPGAVHFSVPKTKLQGSGAREYLESIKAAKKSSGADGYYLLHNHPSGNPSPSQGDIYATNAISMMTSGLKGHVIIDQDKYSVFTNEHNIAEYGMQSGGYKIGENPFGDQSLAHTVITSVSRLAAAAKGLQTVEDVVTLIGIGARGNVTLMAEMPYALLSDNTLRATARVARLMRNSSSIRMFAVTSDFKPVEALLEAGLITDAIKPTSPREASWREINHDIHPDHSVATNLGRKKVRAIGVQERAALFSKSEVDAASPGAMTEQAIRAEANKFLDTLATKPNLVIVPTHDQLPADLMAAFSEGRAASDVNAMYRKGSIYLVQDRMKSADQVREAVIHETAHFAVETLFDYEARHALLDELAKVNRMETVRRGVKAFGKTVRDVNGKVTGGFDPSNATQRRVAANEVMAYYAQKYMKNESMPARIKRVVERWIAAIRDAVNRFFGRQQALDELHLKAVIQDVINRLKRGDDAMQAAADDRAMASNVEPFLPRGAVMEVSLTNSNPAARGPGAVESIGPTYLMKDGRILVDGLKIAVGDSVYLSPDNKRVTRGPEELIEKIEKDQVEAEQREINLKPGYGWRNTLSETSMLIDRKVAFNKNKPRPMRENEDFFDYILQTSAAKSARYRNVPPTQVRDAEWIDSVTNEHDPDKLFAARLKESSDKEMERRRFEIGNFLHVTGDRPLTKGQRSALLNYRNSGGRLGKSVLDAFDEFDNPAPLASTIAPTFFSALTRAAETAKLNKGSAQQWAATIKNAKGVKIEEIEWSGINEWLASQTSPVTKEQVVEYLRANEIDVQEVVKGAAEPGELSKSAELQRNHDDLIVGLSANGLRVITSYVGVENIENTRGPTTTYSLSGDEWMRQTALEERPATEDELSSESREMLSELDSVSRELYGLPREDDIHTNATRYGQYALPGGSNYRELLLTLPGTKIPNTWKIMSASDANIKHPRFRSRDPSRAGWGQDGFVVVDTERNLPPVGYDQLFKTEAEAIAAANVKAGEDGKYSSAHWTEPNILAHVRFDERVDAEGKRVLHIAEVQSDFGQATRKSKLQVVQEVKADFAGIVDRMKAAGVLEVECD